MRKNLGLKLFSLLIALLLSYFVRGEGNMSVIGLFVPIELKHVPDNKTVVWPVNRQAQVQFKGPSHLVSEIAASPPTIKIDVPNDVGNKFMVNFKSADMALPPGVRILGIDPPEMEFVLDRVVVKEVPVQLTQIGSLTDGLRVSESSVSPAKVRVIAAESDLASIANLETEPLDLREVRGDLETNVALRVPSKVIDIAQRSVRVRVHVSSIQSSKRLSGVPIEVRKIGGDGVTVTPTEINVEITGPRDVVGDLKARDVVAYVRLLGDVAPDTLVKVSFELPRSVTLVAAEPESVRVRRTGSAVEPVARGGKVTKKPIAAAKP